MILSKNTANKLRLFIVLTPAENPLCLGHDDSYKQFLKVFDSGRLPHSWIIVGPKGVGKRTFCYHLIRTLFSKQTILSPQDPLFRRIASRSHGDLLILEKREEMTNLSVEDIRSVKSFLQKTAVEGGWRIVLLDGLDQINRFGANALLKSLEEPPPQTLFFLTAQTLAGILPTIRSRCQVLSLKPLEDESLKSALTQMGYALDLEETSAVLPLAQGCLGKAVYFLQEERWKKIIAFHTCLLRACLPSSHPHYQAPFTSENIALLAGEELSFWEESVVGWLQNLLKKGIVLQTLTPEERDVFEQASPALWWYRLDQLKAQLKRGIKFHLDSLHTLSCALNLLTKT